MRAKYNSAWKFSESAALVSGLGYDRVKGVAVYNRAENVNVVGVEVGGNPKEMLDAWNKATGTCRLM